MTVLCGPSHSGKSTFARKLYKSGQNFALISTDQIRMRLSVGFGDPEYESKVWDIYESLKQKALRQGESVILDACHISKKPDSIRFKAPIPATGKYLLCLICLSGLSAKG